MKNPMAHVLLLLLVFGSTQTADGQSRKGTAAATFLTLGVGARATAVGHAFTAVATGADGLFWNPAGIARPHPSSGQRGSAMFSNHRWFVDVNFAGLGAVVPVTGSGAVGLSVVKLDYGDQLVRTVDMPEGTGETFSSMDISIGLSYAQQLTDYFYLGGSAKGVRQNIRDMKASAVAFDIGFVLETNYLNGIQLGASIQNFGGKMQMDGINSEEYIDIDPTTNFNQDAVPARIKMDAWSLPLTFKFGVMIPAVRAGQYKVSLMAESHQTNDNDLNADVGGIASYELKTILLEARMGYKDLGLTDVDSHLTYGAGLDIRLRGLRVAFDFAYVPFDRLGDVRMIDFRLHF
ncbi:MAG: PorV/PorQ family protein [Bacteroidetes bacterium SB0662_bin_6]|nr:PorV/PorQ family protein [Bacteroidetes bacterium SB0668_bin_1]MYE04961.1 PorV/PorQ family protein [Bacteroidetes bacterium SB0662_bin_6]